MDFIEFCYLIFVKIDTWSVEEVMARLKAIFNVTSEDQILLGMPVKLETDADRELFILACAMVEDFNEETKQYYYENPDTEKLIEKFEVCRLIYSMNKYAANGLFNDLRKQRTPPTDFKMILLFKILKLNE